MLDIATAIDIANDPALFAEKMLLVQNKAKQHVSLVYNRAQRHYLANRTRRDLILKARQLGFSTAIQGELFRLYTTGPESVLVMSDTNDNTSIFRRMVQGFYDNIPPSLPKPARSLDNATITVYPNIGSEVHIRTAGSLTSGRSTSFTRIHGSEVAFWANGNAVIAGALQAVPEHLDNTWVVFESTANGAQGWFYNECMAALQGDSEWKLHFYAWWWDDDYQLPLEPGEQIAYTDEEQRLADKHNLSPEQIKWRRKKQRDLKGRFQQEYPETPEAAFIHSGQIVFMGVDDVLHTEQYTPTEGHTYIAGVDWGQDKDYTALCIIDQTTQQEVYINRWRRMPWGDMRRLIVEECLRWGVGGIVPERNSMGSSQIEALYNDLVDAGLYNIVIKPFVTSNPSKHEIVTLLGDAIGNEAISLLDVPYATAEIKAYQMRQLPSGVYAYSAPESSDDDDNVINDDTVMARMLAWYGCNALYL